MGKRPSRSLEVKVISGEGLCLGTRPVKKNAFVVLRAEEDERNECATSKMAGATGREISWNNEKLCLDLPYRSRFLIAEVYTSGKLVGSARIPVTDFAGGYHPENLVQFLSYRLRDGYGVRNGIINISVKVKSTTREITTVPAAWHPEIGFPVVNRITGGRNIVVGVPVSYASPFTY
ncbi:hypothetical protein MLD38_038995 [Melastoma candidum]|uniref:Uncharacterized protein n=1 Tax=Melastoma candidum TaxID=119954 RepID=A0ACB9L262_9MYRT|nr:hypothetical protein MLD38_038995 [Melastoma candidum]